MGERVKLTESVVANLEARLEANGRDLGKPVDTWDAELPGLLLRRERTGRKTWHLRFRADAGWTRIKLGDYPTLSAVEARKAAKVEAAKVAKGTDPVAERKANKDKAKARKEQAKRDAAAVLGTFIDGEYKAWAEKHLRSHKATLNALKADFANWWSRPMGSLTVMDVERWRRSALAGGNQKSTVNRAWQRLRAVLGKAHEWGLIGLPPKIKRFKLDARGRVRYLTADERIRFLAALDRREQQRREERARMIKWQRERGLESFPPHGTYTDHLKPLTLLVMNTGLRRGEALGLTWGAIDFARDMIHVEAVTSKSGQSRDIPMTVEARKVLEAWHKQQAEPDSTVYLFALPDGARLQSIGHKTWGEIMAAAKIKDFRFHDLRHDYASRLVMADVDLYSVSKLLGHSDVAMTQRYAHLAPDYLRAAVRKLEKAASAA